MRRAATLVQLALGELWTSFRLLAMLGVLVAGGVATVAAAELQPGAGARGALPGWYAVTLAVAVAIVGGLVAGAFAAQRRRGFAAWLVARTVPRATLVVAWLVAAVLPLLAGVALSALIAWLTLVSHGTDPAASDAFAAAAASCGAAGVAALALALVAGVLLPPAAATAAALALTGGWLVGAILLLPAEASVPGGGFVTLASLHLAAEPAAVSTASAGASLALAAGLLVIALAAFSRIDL